jgi:opacity protein-like surface antigen
MKKIVLLTFLALFLVSSAVYAAQPAYQMNDNRVSLKMGYNFPPNDDFYDIWGDDESFSFEIAYERKTRDNIGIEVAIGDLQSSLTADTILYPGDSSEIDVENIYISPSIKFYFPLNDLFVAYAGAGPDVYFTWIEHNYKSTAPAISKSEKDNFQTLGAHILAGIDWFVYTESRNDEYNLPVSIFLEYRYSWVNVNEADGLMIDALDSSEDKNDLDVGGNTFSTGLRFHF